MSNDKLKSKENDNIKDTNNILTQSTEQTVCAPEFPDGCMDVEMED